MGITKYIAGSIGLMIACAPSVSSGGDPEALVIYAQPHVVSAQSLASEIRLTGHTSCYLGFAPGSAKLDVTSFAQVQELAAMLREDAELKVVVTIRSNSALNPAMAHDRASVLVATLRDLDVMPRRVIAAPATNPVAVAFNDLAGGL